MRINETVDFQGYFALSLKCQLRKGQSVLIFTGGNPIALAGISITQGMDCTVFVMVRNETDKKKVQDVFPLLNGRFIGKF